MGASVERRINWAMPVVVFSLVVVLVSVAAILFVNGPGRPSSEIPDTIVSDDANGSTVAVLTNATVHVVLHSTYWKFQPVTDSRVVGALHDPVVTPDATVRIPGTGAGTVTLDLRAVGPGTAQVSATRETCGEALRCAENQRSFTVTIVVHD
jgi:hypothetical protein